jgi:hypothetical protein
MAQETPVFGEPLPPFTSKRAEKHFCTSAWHLLACWFAKPISSTLKMEVICSSETSVETQRTTPLHIPEDDSTLHLCTWPELLGLELKSESPGVIADISGFKTENMALLKMQGRN